MARAPGGEEGLHEHGLEEARDTRDPAGGDVKDDDTRPACSGIPRVAEEANEAMLLVGSGGYEPEVLSGAPSRAGAEEPGDGVNAVVEVGRRRHGEPGVVGE